MPIKRRRTPLKSRQSVGSRTSQVVSTKTRVTQKHFVDTTPVKSVIAGAGDSSALSPGWVAGELAVFKSPSPRRTRRSSAFHQISTQNRQTISVFKTPATFSFKSPPGVKTRSRRSSVYFMNGDTIIEKVVKHASRPSLSSGKRKAVTQVSNVPNEPEKKLPGQPQKSRFPAKSQITKMKKISPAKRQTRSMQVDKSATPPISVKRKTKVLSEKDSPAKREKTSSIETNPPNPPVAAQTVNGVSSAKRKVGHAIKQPEIVSPSLSRTPVKDDKPRSSRRSNKSTKSTSSKRVRPQMCAKEMLALLDDSLTISMQLPRSARSARKSSKRTEPSVSSPILEQSLGSSPFPSMKTLLSGKLVNSKSPIKTPRRKLSINSSGILSKDVKVSVTPSVVETYVRKVLENKQTPASIALKEEVKICGKQSPLKTPAIKLFENKKAAASTPIKEIKMSVEPSPIKTPAIKSLDDKKNLSATPLNEIKITDKLSTIKSSLSKTLEMTKDRRSLLSRKLDSKILNLSCGDSPIRKSDKQSASKLIKLRKSLGSLPQEHQHEAESISKVTSAPRKESCKKRAVRSQACSPLVNADKNKKRAVTELKSFSQITPLSKLIISSPSNYSTPKSSSKLLTLQQQNSAAKKKLKESQDTSFQCKNKNLERLKLSASETLPKRPLSVRKSIESETNVPRVNTRSEITVPTVNIQSVADLTSRKRKQTVTAGVSSSKRRRFQYRKDSPLISSTTTHETSAMCLSHALKRNRIDEEESDGKLSYVRSVSLSSDQEEEDLNQTISKSRSWCSIM